MEKINKKKKSCSVFTVIIVLILIFLFFLSVLLYLKFISKITFTNLLDSKNINSLSINESITGQLNEQKDENEVTIYVNESDLNNSLKSLEDSFVLKNASAKITSEKIIISGKMKSGIISLGVEVSIIPEVVNNKISYKITDIRAGGVPAPKQVFDQVSRSLDQYFSNLLSSTENIEVSSIKLNSGFMSITGRKK